MEMERQLVIRILAEACGEYATLAEELDRRDGFRRYVMRRAESAGFTAEEIADAVNLAPFDVEEILREDRDGTAGEDTPDVKDFDGIADVIGHLNLEMDESAEDGHEEAHGDEGAAEEHTEHPAFWNGS